MFCLGSYVSFIGNSHGLRPTTKPADATRQAARSAGQLRTAAAFLQVDVIVENSSSGIPAPAFAGDLPAASPRSKIG